MLELMTRRVPRLLASAALLAAAGLMATPPAIAQEFRGGGYISDLANCDGISFGGGIRPVTARYQPGELPGNEESSLTIMDGFTYSFNLRRPGNVFQGRFRPMRGTHLIPTPERIRPDPRLRVERQFPNSIDQNTDRMRLTLRVRHLFGIRGCRGVIDLEMLRQ